MTKCQFCGVEEKPTSSRAADHCKWVGSLSEKFKGRRSFYCYEREIAKLKTRLAQATEFVEFLADNPIKDMKLFFNKSRSPNSWKDGEVVCRYCLHSPCKPDCVVVKARDFMDQAEKG